MSRAAGSLSIHSSRGEDRRPGSNSVIVAGVSERCPVRSVELRLAASREPSLVIITPTLSMTRISYVAQADRATWEPARRILRTSGLQWKHEMRDCSTYSAGSMTFYLKVIIMSKTS
ncbi:uncharacterized protein LOC114251420 [Bombyx mandarina]|uniref:Uncharacterized protein LOC114251420 n=1 Tax=Bombyx mandarina TaxID=7092 RepID=A0A6J2KKK2_BOMMA|nr:uncharacterized protein LOC114251420 [Bombyx mandarina]